MVREDSSADLRMAVVGSPAYFRDYPSRAPHDLSGDQCLQSVSVCRGPAVSIVWEFEKAGEALEVEVGGPLTLGRS